MYLTNPAALWLLLLCLLPLLLSRRKPRARHVVSNVYLWREAVRRAVGHVAPRRPRRTWLVLVQIACIGAIVLSLAGPVVTLEGGNTALVFDLSASMAARDGEATRIDTARARVRSVVGQLPRFARVRLILATASPRLAGEWTASDPFLLATVDALTPTSGTADVPGAIELAAAEPDVSSIIVLSDTSIAALNGGRDWPAVQLVRIGGMAENAAVTRVAIRRTALGRAAGEVLVVLRNYGIARREADVEISIDGRVVHRGHAELLPGLSQTLNLALPDLGHFVSARLAGNDALSIDDFRSVAVPLANAIRVALIGPRGSFLERALAVNPSVSLRTYDQHARLQEIGAAADFDVLVCDRCSDAHLAGISSLVVTEGGEPIQDVVRVVTTTHPLARALEPGQQMATVFPSTSDNRAEVVLRVGRVPAVTAFEGDGQRKVDIHLDLTHSDFVLNAAFPVLIANTVEWLAAHHALPPEITAGDPLAFTLPQSTSVVRVLGPEGRARDVRRTGGQVIVADTEAAGLYRIEANGSERVVAVNANAVTESDLSGTQNAPLKGTEGTAVRVRAPMAVGAWLVLLGLGLLALEWRLRLEGA